MGVPAVWAHDDLADGIKAVHRHIHDAWPKTVRRSDPKNTSELALPKPFVVPTVGQQFHSFFYWDMFFTNAGLLRHGQERLARDNAEDFIYEVEDAWRSSRIRTPIGGTIARKCRWRPSMPTFMPTPRTASS